MILLIKRSLKKNALQRQRDLCVVDLPTFGTLKADFVDYIDGVISPLLIDHLEMETLLPGAVRAHGDRENSTLL